MSRLRTAICWWEPMLPPGLRLHAAHLTLPFVRTLMRLGVCWRRGIFIVMRLSGRLPPAGFNAWRFWERKWR